MGDAVVDERDRTVRLQLAVQADARDAVVARLAHELDHYAYPTIAAWVEKHNRYAIWEAAMYARFLREPVPASIGRGKQFKRRLKKIYLRLPLRFVIRFVYAYVFRLGFLDGMPGLVDWMAHGQVSRLLQRGSLRAGDATVLPGDPARGRPSVLLYPVAEGAAALARKIAKLGVKELALASSTFPEDFCSKLEQTLKKEGIRCTTLET